MKEEMLPQNWQKRAVNYLTFILTYNYIVIEMLASKNLIMNGKHEEDLEYREASLLQ